MMQYVEFPSGLNTLRGMLHVPDHDGPHPCAMFCHGFTGNRIEAHFLFVRLARRLEGAGIAALRFDFAGSGESDGEFEEMTTSGELADARSGLAFLRAHSAIDADRIGVVGLSLGGAVAALLAGECEEGLRAVVLLSAVADPARIASFIRTGKYETQLAEWGYLDMHGLRVSRAFLQDLEDLRPADDIARFTGAVLVVHGSRDESVPLSEAYTYRQKRAGASGATHFEVIADADHTFSSLEHVETVGRLVETFFSKELA